MPFSRTLLYWLSLACVSTLFASVKPLPENVNGIINLQLWIEEKLAAGVKKVVVPPGRYRVAPKGGVHLRFTDLKDIELVMEGVEMVCTETTQAITFSRCKNVRLIGLTIDYDPLPFTQGQIVAMGPDKSWIDFKLDEGYPENSLSIRVEIFDKNSAELKCATRYDWEAFEKIGERLFRVRKGDGYRYNPTRDLEELGDVLVTNNDYAPGGFNAHAIVSSDCTDLILDDVTLYASNCFSFLEYNCDNSTYLRCKLDRRSLADDAVRLERMRYRSGNADAFHSKYALRGPKLLSCQAAYMGDDGLNICGSYYMVASSSGTKVRLISRNPPRLLVGDPLELMTYDGVRLPEAKVAQAPKKTGTTAASEADFFRKQSMNASIRGYLSGPDATVWEIVLDRTVDLPIGSVLCASNRIGSGFAVKDCTFGPNRSRGILIKGSQGSITGNKLVGNWGSAILITPEWWWLEAGSSDDVSVSDNSIVDCRNIAIQVTASAGSGEPAPAGAHQRITVINNRIKGSRLPAISVGSTDTGKITGNVIVTDATGEAISLINNTRLEVSDNSVSAFSK